MSYSKTVFFIPVWFDDFKRFSERMATDMRWEPLAADRLQLRYLFHYTKNIATDKRLFRSYSLKNISEANIYLCEEEIAPHAAPIIEDVRFSCFATGVGFMEFWVSYSDVTVGDVANFSYMFKKATRFCEKELKDGKRALYDAAVWLLPDKTSGTLFFSASDRLKFECNCFHFLHLDQAVPDAGTAKEELEHLCRSYKSTMSLAREESAYDMMYRAADNDFWSGSTEGLVNILYDEAQNEKDFYLHKFKLTHLEMDYYFLYLLLLNQKYAAVAYIDLVAKAQALDAKGMEALNRRIIQLNNVFSFNVVSDDRHFQNVYAKMFSLLEIRHLLADVIENEQQMEVLQNAKHARDDRLSNKYLFGISLLTLFSALIDAAAYFDRFNWIRPLATPLSLMSVALVVGIAVAWAIHSTKK